MKRYAVADEVPEDCDYLTAGKEYDEIGLYNPEWGVIQNDKGALIPIKYSEDDNLNGKSWRIVEREDEQDATFRKRAAIRALTRAG